MAKLWRKLAKKEPVTGKRNGRMIKQMMWMQEYAGRTTSTTTPLISALIARAEFDPLPLTKKQIAANEAAAKLVEVSNEAQ